MTPTRSVLRFSTFAALAFSAVLALSLPAHSEDQEILALLGGSTSMTTPPSALVDLGSLVVGLNTASGGNITVQSNTAYTVTVVADRAKMTSWDADLGVYGSDTLASALIVVPTLTGGLPVPVPATAGTTPAPIFTGTGLTTDSVSLQLQQTVGVGDKPGTYRSVLTYTASAGL